MSDIFYYTNDLNLDKRIDIFNLAKELCYNWWVDILDCSKSFAREKIEMSYEDAMKKFNMSSHFRVILRREYWRNPIKEYIQVVYRTSTTPDYFLWIEVDSKHLDTFIEKFNLKPIDELKQQRNY